MLIHSRYTYTAVLSWGVAIDSTPRYDGGRELQMQLASFINTFAYAVTNVFQHKYA